MIRVFYDGSCSLCSREIAFYKRVSEAVAIDWVDISKSGDQLTLYGLGYDEAMSQFHVQDEDGQLLRGVEAFLLLWSRISPFQILGFLVGLPVIKQIAIFAYARFAKWRQARPMSCALPKSVSNPET